MEIIIITGPPYSGKGTQCELLKTTLGYNHISTGDRVRKEKKEQSLVGKIMTGYEENGTLVPDEIMQNLLGHILDENMGAKGIILDGYPRTIAQVDSLLELLAGKLLSVQLVINIQLPHVELLARAKKRAATSNRKDDQDIETHLRRIKIFESETRPAIEYMKENFPVVTIDGLGTIESITQKITDVIKTNK